MQEVPLPVYTSQDERIERLEALVHRLLGDSRIGASLLGPFPESASVVGLRHAGTNYFLSNTLNSRPNLTTRGIASNWLYAVPFYVPEHGRIVDRLALEVTTLAAGSARLGIYSSERNLYPGVLELDAGWVDVTATGIRAATIRHTLTRGLKWLVTVPNCTPTVRAVADSAGLWTPLGVDPSIWQSRSGWCRAFSYAALPTRFPSGGGMLQIEPLLMLRFAA